MKKELEYFTIGSSYGGNQDWMVDPWMHLGGCGALTACDTSIYLARKMGIKELYPFDVFNIKKADYMKFAKIMKPFLSPRMSGINTLKLFMDGFTDYMKSRDRVLPMKGFSGSEDAGLAMRKIKEQIDKGFPIPTLTLSHKNKAYRDYVWHWYLMTGYNDEEDFSVRLATYGEGLWMNFKGLWDTGEEEKGGLVLF